MKTLAIRGTERKKSGTSYSNYLRDAGYVPCVVYGGNQNKKFLVERSSLKDLVYTADAHFVDLDIDGKHHKAIMQEIQFHPVSEMILHVDFRELNEKRPITVEIPVHVVGNSPGVRMGGRLIQKVRRLKIKGLPKDMPEHIEVNIDNLEIGKSIKVEDLNLPGVQVQQAGNIPLVTVMRPRTLVQLAEEAEAEEAAQAAGAEAEEGKEGAEGASNGEGKEGNE